MDTETIGFICIGLLILVGLYFNEKSTDKDLVELYGRVKPIKKTGTSTARQFFEFFGALILIGILIALAVAFPIAAIIILLIFILLK